MDRPWKVIFAFVGVFVAGAVFGGFFTLRSSGKRWEKELLMQKQVFEAQTAAAVANAVAHTKALQAAPPAPGASAAAPAPAQPAPQAAARNAISASLMRQFATRLKLSGEQRDKMRPILARWGEDFQHLRQDNERQQQQYLADSERLGERMYREVGELLTADQRAELETMRRESQDRAARERQKRLEAAIAAKGAKNANVVPVAAKQAEKTKPAGP